MIVTRKRAASPSSLSHEEEAATNKRVRFAQHRERRFAPDEAALLDDERTHSVPTTPKVEERREAALALRAHLEENAAAVPSLEAMRRLVDAKLEALQRLLDRQAEWTPPEDPDDGFFARVPRFTRLPGLWGARDQVPVTLESLAVLRRLRATLADDDVASALSSAWAEGPDGPRE